MLKAFLREPMVHFLALAGLVFAAYGALRAPFGVTLNAIDIPPAKVEQLASQFATSWKRPPSANELKALIDETIKEEVLYREAIAIGLDKNDEVIRRRLRMKLEFLQSVEVDALAPSDAELLGFLKANAGKFELEPQATFQQIYFNPSKRGHALDGDTAMALDVLRKDSNADPDQFGDATMLPFQPQETTRADINRMFGDTFFEALSAPPLNVWTGPVRSDLGMHLVRILDRSAGRTPELVEIRAILVREWLAEKRKALEKSRYLELLRRYPVTVGWPQK